MLGWLRVVGAVAVLAAPSSGCLDGWNRFVVQGGIGHSSKDFLSANADYTGVELAYGFDDDGRERWTVAEVPGQPGRVYLTVDDPSGAPWFLNAVGQGGSSVSLVAADDGTGRQHWVMSEVAGNQCFTFKNVAFARSQFKWLSTDPTGAHVFDWGVDDGSGRQRWCRRAQAEEEEAAAAAAAVAFAWSPAAGAMSDDWRLTAAGGAALLGCAALVFAAHKIRQARAAKGAEAEPLLHAGAYGSTLA